MAQKTPTKDTHRVKGELSARAGERMIGMVIRRTKSPEETTKGTGGKEPPLY